MLTRDARALLALLVDVLKGADPQQPQTFITYSKALTRLGIEHYGGNAGLILQSRGLDDLGHWTRDSSGIPAITGLIVIDKEFRPGSGYFRLYSRSYPEDYSWWLEQMQLSKIFDWLPFLDVGNKTAGDREAALLSEARRMARLIFMRVAVSGEIVERTAPERTAPDNLVEVIINLLRPKPLICYLCERTMQLKPDNRLFQPSPDRVDSNKDSYGTENLRLAHLACNLAKNASSVEEFREWLGFIRGDKLSCR